jgi:hypothetical protein
MTLQPESPAKKRDFFVSYNRHDHAWAEWIASELEEAGKTVWIQAWDFRAGGNFVLDMQRAAAESERTLAVVSPDYLQSEFCQPEWAAAFAKDPSSKERRLLTVRVRPCEMTGLLRPILYIDFVDRSEEEAREALLSGISPERRKPKGKPIFPGSKPAEQARASTATPVPFPGKQGKMG